MINLLPTFRDLLHLYWIVLVIGIAAFLRGMVWYLDKLADSANQRVMADLEKPVYRIRVARSWSEPASKGFTSPSVVNLEAHRRRRQLGAVSITGSRMVN